MTAQRLGDDRHAGQHHQITLSDRLQSRSFQRDSHIGRFCELRSGQADSAITATRVCVLTLVTLRGRAQILWVRVGCDLACACCTRCAFEARAACTELYAGPLCCRAVRYRVRCTTTTARARVVRMCHRNDCRACEDNAQSSDNRRLTERTCLPTERAVTSRVAALV